MSDDASLPMIVGGGPVGLAASLFLMRHGIRTRVIERRADRSPQSRALAINPRTLELLEETGVTARILERGIRITGARMWHDGKKVVEINFLNVRHRFPFLVALSQSVTEQLLEEALISAGGRLERGIELTNCRNAADDIAVEYRNISDNTIHHARCPWLLAADGAHSTVRGAEDLAFEGDTFSREWSLIDLPLETNLAHDRAHIFLMSGGRFVFCIRVVVNAAEETNGPALWRIIGNGRDPVRHLIGARPAGEPVWASRFRIEHRIAERMESGRIYLAGDAAHVHSPIGARGMNLGIEDAWTFAQLSAAGQVSRYAPLRYTVDRRVMKRIEMITRLVRGESPGSRFVRRFVMPRLLGIPFFQRKMFTMITGLDHPLTPQFMPPARPSR